MWKGGTFLQKLCLECEQENNLKVGRLVFLGLQNQWAWPCSQMWQFEN